MTRASSISSISGAKVEVPVVAERDLGSHLDGDLEDERLAFLGLDDVDLGVGQRQDVLLDERVAIGVLDEVLDGVVDDGAGRQLPFEERSRRLARAETRDARSSREVADGLVDGALESLGGDLDLEVDGGVGTGGPRDLHSTAKYTGGPAAVGGSVGRSGPRHAHGS